MHFIWCNFAKFGLWCLYKPMLIIKYGNVFYADFCRSQRELTCVGGGATGEHIRPVTPVAWVAGPLRSGSDLNVVVAPRWNLQTFASLCSLCGYRLGTERLIRHLILRTINGGLSDDVLHLRFSHPSFCTALKLYSCSPTILFYWNFFFILWILLHFRRIFLPVLIFFFPLQSRKKWFCS